MKKQLLVAAACLASAAASYGQGFVNFENYGPGLNVPITYDANPAQVPAGKAGLTLGGTFRAQLAFGIGTITDQNQLTRVASSISSFTPSAVDGGSLATGAGYWIFGSVALPGVDSGNSGAITFQVLVWNSAGGVTGFDTAAVAGRSALFTQAVATGNQPVPTFAGHLTSFQVRNTPEPGTLALAGLGAAGLLLFRRRK